MHLGEMWEVNASSGNMVMVREAPRGERMSWPSGGGAVEASGL